MDQITQDRKQFHRPVASYEEPETCTYCGKLLSKVMDEINGVELVCNNPDCPGK